MQVRVRARQINMYYTILHGVGACLSVCPGPCELMSLRNLVPLRLG